MGAALANRSPLVVLGGRAPAFRWGQGSLQEVDHVPFVRPLSVFAATAGSPGEMPGLVDGAFAAALRPPGGPAFVDFPLDHVFSDGPAGPLLEPSEPDPAGTGEPDGPALERAVALLRAAERPVVMAGTGVWWGHAEEALRRLAEELRVPVFLNGQARGCVPADHELAFARTRGHALKGADVALVVGVPLDFRLGFGAAFGEATRLVLVDRTPPEREPQRQVAAALHGALPATLDVLREGAAGGPDRSGWVADLRERERAARAAEREGLEDDRAPLHPLRLYGELAQVLDRDAIVIGDGGDFVSWAGRVVDSYVPGAWIDPGPFGCLGAGPGYALGAALARPGRQVVVLLGDGAFGFSGLEWDTLVRFGIPVVGVVGNNGIWGLEKHPMEQIYGWSVAADLRPGTRYDRVVEALGGHGELVERPQELRPALERAFAAGRPALVNVLCDPAVAYPRRSSLA